MAVVQEDYRIGGEVRHLVTVEPKPLMVVPDEVRKCVAFLGYRIAGGPLRLAGTVFFMGRVIEGTDRAFNYAVTAKSVIDRIRAGGADKVHLRLNFKGGPASWLEIGEDDWLSHPDDPAAGVAVLRVAVPEECDHLAAPVTMAATEEVIGRHRIGAGEEVFVTGLFANHHGRQRNIPIVRAGHIAAMPEEQVETEIGLLDAYLVEVKSAGGLTGSPVFVRPEGARHKGGRIKTGMKPDWTYYLLGIVQGHWDSPLSDVDSPYANARSIGGGDTGISIVVPATKVLEVIRQPLISRKEEAFAEELRRQRLPITDCISDS